MNTASDMSEVLDGPAPQSGPGVEVSAAGLPSWRVCLAAAFGLAAVTLWYAVARLEGQFARRAVSPESNLLSSAELEDQLNM